MQITYPKEVPVSAPLAEVTPKPDNSNDFFIKGTHLNIYYCGEPVTFTVNAPDHDEQLHYSIFNTLTGECIKGCCRLKLAAVCFTLDFTPCRLKRGHYELTVVINGGVLYTRFAILQHSAGCKNPRNGITVNGVCDIAENYRYDYYHAAMPAADGWIKEEIRLCDVLQPDGFTVYDKTITLARLQGARICACFTHYPEHLLMGGIRKCDLAAVYGIIKTVAEHFAGRIDAYDITPDAQTEKNATPEEYTAFCKAIALAINAAGNAVIIGGTGYRDEQFTKRCIANGLYNYCDAIGISLMPDDKDVADLCLHDNSISRYFTADDAYKLPLCITDACTDAVPDSEPLCQYLQDAAFTAIITAQCAYYGIAQCFARLLPHRHSGTRVYGMFTSDNTPLPAYTAYRTAAQMLGECKVLGKTTLPCNGFAVDTGTEKVLMLWSDEPCSINLQAKLPLVVTDMNGCDRCIAPKNGLATLTVGNFPVYVHFNDISADFYLAKDQTPALPLRHKALNAGQTLFVRISLPDDTLPYFAPVPDEPCGYRMYDSTPATAEIYNLGSVSRNIELQYVCSDGIRVLGVTPATVPAMHRIFLPLEMYSQDTCCAVVTCNLFADGELCGTTVVHFVCNE